jgi:hypothetical protein
VNWLIWEKMFINFCNKFRLVNCVYYIKCGVSSSLHNSGCCIRSVAPWITILSQHTVFTKRWYITNLLLCNIPQNKTPRTGPHHIWCTVPFLWLQEEHRWQSSWVEFASHCLLWILLLRLAAAAVPLLLVPQNSLLTSLAFAPNSEAVSNQNITDCFLFKFYLFFRPLLENHNHLPCLDYYVWLGTVSET